MIPRTFTAGVPNRTQAVRLFEDGPTFAHYTEGTEFATMGFVTYQTDLTGYLNFELPPLSRAGFPVTGHEHANAILNTIRLSGAVVAPF